MIWDKLASILKSYLQKKIGFAHSKVNEITLFIYLFINHSLYYYITIYEQSQFYWL